MSRSLTKAQERELVAYYHRDFQNVRPLSIRKFRLMGFLEADGLSEDGEMLARALEHEQQLEEGELA